MPSSLRAMCSRFCDDRWCVQSSLGFVRPKAAFVECLIQKLACWSFCWVFCHPCLVCRWFGPVL